MLSVIKHAPPAVFQMAHGIRDHPQIFIERRLERDINVKVPRLAEDGDDRRFRREQTLHDGIISG